MSPHVKLTSENFVEIQYKASSGLYLNNRSRFDRPLFSNPDTSSSVDNYHRTLIICKSIVNLRFGKFILNTVE